MQERIENISQEFFKKLWVNIQSLSITQEKEHIFLIDLKTDDSALLIGNRGQTLSDLKRVLWLLLSRSIEKKIIVHIEVNNYLEERDNKLFEFIEEKIALCKKLEKDIQLPYFSPYERKKIHNYIGEKNPKNISTKSEWEDKNRRLFICVKKEKMTLDIDWIDI